MSDSSPDGPEKERRASQTAVAAGLASEEDAATLGKSLPGVKHQLLRGLISHSQAGLQARTEEELHHD